VTEIQSISGVILAWRAGCMWEF